MPVLFNSSRPLGRCENLTAVWDAYDGAKRFVRGGFGDLSRHADCPVLVTDEFVRAKPPGSIVVMVSHGITGGKHYGNDQPSGAYTPEACALVDWYATSSEAGRRFRASAAGIPIERCVPLGMPRTDAYVGKEKGDGGTFLAKFPRAYLYAPTFRSSCDEPLPRIDWASLDALMDDDEVLVVKRHMVVRDPMLGGRRYVHVCEADSMEPSTPYLIDCDVLCTDFSSILFDGYLLGKPSVLAAGATDPYLRTRGMYWRYPDQYGSRVVPLRDGGMEAAWLDALRDAAANGMGPVERGCRERTADACDGHSTERVVALVRRLMCES